MNPQIELVPNAPLTPFFDTKRYEKFKEWWRDMVTPKIIENGKLHVFPFRPGLRLHGGH